MMKLYILKQREQIVAEMNQFEIMRYCDANHFSVFFIIASLMTNDWNWHVQYPNEFYICASTMEEAQNFITHAYYKSQMYDGDCGVVFVKAETLYRGG